jgi:hypothetical protein
VSGDVVSQPMSTAARVNLGCETCPGRALQAS